jgi:hypothetical protein
VWKEYFESEVLPYLANRAVVLNWSNRRQWSPSLRVLLFLVFGGTREFNPMAIVFEPLCWPRHFRFYRAFRSLKHGRPDDVDRLRRDFFAQLDELAPVHAG